MPLPLLKAIDRMRDVLFDNTVARRLPANNALLWGARGMGKSSLVKAVHAAVGHEVETKAGDLKLVEIHREDIGTLPRCLMHLRETKGKRFILFCDDLSFEARDTSYKSLKAVLEGGNRGAARNMCCSTRPRTGAISCRGRCWRMNAPPPSLRPRPSRKKCRCRTALVCGSASTIVVKPDILTRGRSTRNDGHSETLNPMRNGSRVKGK
jgi:hypothetical protein